MTHVRPAIDELAEFLNRSAASFASAMARLAKAAAGDSRYDSGAAIVDLTDLISETMTLADLHGRRRALLEFDAASHAAGAQSAPPAATFAASPIVPSVPFESAVQDLLTREPRLAETYQEVAELYRTRHAFAAARSSSRIVTAKVQEAIAKAVREGKALASAEAAVAEVGDWSRAYAETVYRTNVATAYSAGRIRQAFDPAIGQVMIAFERRATGDRDTRPHHQAASGLLAAKTDPVWDMAMIPSGYGCRCQIRLVSRFECERRGLLDSSGNVIKQIPARFSEYYPDPGFGGRPDLAMYRG